MIDFGPLNDAVLDVFGEPCTFKLPGGDIDLEAAFDQERDIERIGAAPFADERYTLQMRQSDVDANGIALRSTVTVRGTDYQVLDMTSDTAGWAMLTVRRYG